MVCDAIVAYRSLFSEECIASILLLVGLARQRGVPVVFTRWDRVDSSRGDAIDAKCHWSDYVAENETDLFLAVKGVEVTGVHHTNALTSSTVRDLVEGGKRAVVCGSWTESCVLHTCRACIEENKHCIVVKEACAGHFPSSMAALMTLQALYAEVVSL